MTDQSVGDEAVCKHEKEKQSKSNNDSEQRARTGKEAKVGGARREVHGQTEYSVIGFVVLAKAQPNETNDSSDRNGEGKWGCARREEEDAARSLVPVYYVFVA